LKNDRSPRRPRRPQSKASIIDRDVFNSARLKKNMAVADVADQAGVCKSSVMQWLSGSRTPTIANVHRLSEVLGVPWKKLIK